MLTDAEREAKYREQWTRYAPVLTTLGDAASIQTMVARLVPWTTHKTFYGPQYDLSTSQTRGLYACARWWVFTHEQHQHTQECRDRYRRDLDRLLEAGDAVDAFEQKYPRHCRHCGGSGLDITPGTTYRDGSGDPPSIDGCPKCVGRGACPLCGALHDAEWEGDACDCGYRPNQSETAPAYDMLGELECVCRSWNDF